MPTDGEYEAISPVEAFIAANMDSPQKNNEGARNLLRNRAADLGADVVVVTEFSPQQMLGSATIKGIAYRRKASPATAPARPRAKGPVLKVPAGRLAVLDFKAFDREIKAEQVHYFTDLVRRAAVRAGPQIEVLTRENLFVLLRASGKDPSQCEGECEVETGRLVGADSIVSGDLQRIGANLKLSLRLHETGGGRLLGAEVASGKNLDELDKAVTQAAERLLLAE
jgi:hypothetical protein